MDSFSSSTNFTSHNMITSNSTAAPIPSSSNSGLSVSNSEPTTNRSLTARLQQELGHIMTSPAPGVTAFPISVSDLTVWAGTIDGPKDTAYEGFSYKVKLIFPVEFPYKAPKVSFTPPIYHPNVEIMSGYVCLDILKSKWSPIYNVQSILISLQSLLGEPNSKSPMNGDAARIWDADKGLFREEVVRVYKQNEHRTM